MKPCNFQRVNVSCYRFVEFRRGGSTSLDYIIVLERTKRMSVSPDSARRQDSAEAWNLDETLLETAHTREAEELQDTTKL